MKTFSFSICTAKEPVQKTLSIDKDSGILKKQPPPFFPNEFKAKLTKSTFSDFAKILDRIKPNQFLIHGVPPEESVKVVTKEKKLNGCKDQSNVVARSAEYFNYPIGKPSLFMIDVDEEGYSPLEILRMLCSIDEVFDEVGYACIQSSSSNIRTKRRHLSNEKWHIYFVAQEGQDIQRFGKALFERAILNGNGRIFISADGKQHVRTFFDLTVIAPYRIDFVAPPKTIDPVYQEKIRPSYESGEYINTQELSDLSAKERVKFNTIVKNLKKDTEDEAKEVRLHHMESCIDEYMEKTNSNRKIAEEVIKARYVEGDEIRLHINDLITFEDEDEETIFVRDIIKDTEQYIGRSVKDPLEPEYGENKAKIYLSRGRLLINSFVHGGRKFILSGSDVREYDTDNNATIVGFRLDADAINGAWAERMLEKWVKVKNGDRIKYAKINHHINKFIPVPEKGSYSLSSSLFETEPIVLYDEKYFLQAMPKVKVITGWDTKKNIPKTQYLGNAFIDLPNISVKENGITMAEPSEEINKYYLNRWLGFPVLPKRGKVHKVIDKYFEEFIDYESEDIYEYFWAYIYHMFQQPFEKPGVAILFQSAQGTGKGTFIQLLSSLIGPIHSGFVDKMESLTGRFNNIIAGKLLIYADEIMFGGYHNANNVLKKIITDEYLTVEAKYQAPQRIYNVSRLFFSTNEQWALHIERGDRRFFVPRVSTAFIQDIDFFTELRYQWNRHYEAVMHRFLTMPINVELSTPPMTKEKMELIDVSMSSAELLFKEILTDGVLENHGIDFAEDNIKFNEDKGTEIKVDILYSIYCAYHNKYFKRQGEAMNKNIFWKEIYSYFGGKDESEFVQKGRIGTSKRRIVFPSLNRMRLLWDESHNSEDF